MSGSPLPFLYLWQTLLIDRGTLPQILGNAHNPSPVPSRTRMETGPERGPTGPFHWASYQQRLRKPQVFQLLNLIRAKVPHMEEGVRIEESLGCPSGDGFPWVFK